jgi:hypothetical protein
LKFQAVVAQDDIAVPAVLAVADTLELCTDMVVEIHDFKFEDGTLRTLPSSTAKAVDVITIL